jgi:hypothetical protein
MNNNTFYHQQQHVADPNNNLFAPIGYSRQRSTSLLPTIGSHRHHHQFSANDELKNNLGKSNSAYPLYMPPTSSGNSRSGIGANTAAAAHDYYMMNTNKLYPLESSK